MMQPSSSPFHSDRSIRFGQQQASKSDWLYTQVAKVYERPFNLKERADSIDKQVEKQKQMGQISIFSRMGNKVKAGALRFAALCSEHDYDRQSEVNLGKIRFKVPNPPKGALMLMLYLATIPPRMYQAYRRGKKDKDYREVGDVMRRDIISVTVFLFGLTVLKKILAKQFQKLFKVNLLDKKSNKVLSYSQFANYRINSLSTLKGILDEGNEEGLRRAINKLHDHKLSKVTGDHRLSTALGQLRQNMYELRQTRFNDPSREGRVEAVYNAMQEAEAVRKKVRADVLQYNTKHSVQLAEELSQPVTHALETYAKYARLPSDMISFGFVAVLLGWFPVWFNKTWNQMQYNRKVDAESHELAKQTL